MPSRRTKSVLAPVEGSLLGLAALAPPQPVSAVPLNARLAVSIVRLLILVHRVTGLATNLRISDAVTQPGLHRGVTQVAAVPVRMPAREKMRGEFPMTNDNDEQARDWLRAELEEGFDEDYELELGDNQVSEEIAKVAPKKHTPTIDRREYFGHLLNLQRELIKLQTWSRAVARRSSCCSRAVTPRARAARIKRITQRLNPRVCRVVALPAPSERERSQWYFQRYVPHLPAAGEIVLFDRSWYNRAGVERVMGFATPAEVEQFFKDAPEFERLLVGSGIILLKYWFFDLGRRQQLRFLVRIHDPMKQWKLSPMDLQSRVRWKITRRPKKRCSSGPIRPRLAGTSSRAMTKRRARLNCMDHLLKQIPYVELPQEAVELPQRVFNSTYERHAQAPELFVPRVYG